MKWKEFHSLARKARSIALYVIYDGVEDVMGSHCDIPHNAFQMGVILYQVVTPYLTRCQESEAA